MEVVLSREYISGLIEKKGISKAEFAKKMGYQRQNLDAMLDAKKKDINTVIKMAEVLGLSLDDFLYGRRSIQLMGFIKLQDKVYEIRQKSDLEEVMEELEKLEKKEV